MNGRDVLADGRRKRSYEPARLPGLGELEWCDLQSRACGVMCGFGPLTQQLLATRGDIEM